LNFFEYLFTFLYDLIIFGCVNSNWLGCFAPSLLPLSPHVADSTVAVDDDIARIQGSG